MRCVLCRDYGRKTTWRSPKDMAIHVEEDHRWEVGTFLKRHWEEWNAVSEK
jgi:hypothetical protein